VQDSRWDVSKSGNFSRIVVPDSILYRQIAESLVSDRIDPVLLGQVTSQLQLSDITEMSFFFLATRNYFGPSFLGYLMSSIRFGDLFINIILVGSTGVIFVKLLGLLNISSTIPLWVLFLNPETIYYSQGFLKEIPCLFLTAMFVYFLLIRKYLRCLLPITLVLLVRYQIAVIFLMILFLEIVPLRYRYKCLQYPLFVFFALLPLLYKTLLNRAVVGYYLYREESGPGTGIGAAIAYLQFNFPFFGYIGVPIRFFQTMIEPFPAMVLFSDGEGVINLYYCILSASMIMMSPFYSLFFNQLFNIVIRGRREIFSYDISKIILTIAMYLLTVGVNTFISHRFIYPIVPLMAFVIFVEERGKKLLAHIIILMAAISIYALNMLGYLLSG